ncbi:PREDICTED: uncharacterized protein LOC105976431 [Erythranthe guttata]|uniref:uncharacterized protein LOC105976431 n=1 Tax=Erythranthe guttata TaxID=4155 RepID=UPI00064D8BAF|nr:PREDICTED: uncharacterized protein LOC105976431 [Erythranthe guttata]|eukprot:XP_012857151.1 PREDICTED: uncharacterized protein LOC105976431 [Erythranthe guttata]
MDQDRAKIMEAGKYNFGTSTLYVRKMPKFFNFDIREMVYVLVWVTLRNISGELYNQKSLSMIGLKIGRPVQMDKNIKELASFSYARIQVEVDASKPLRKSLTLINSLNQSYEVQIEYGYVPPYCTKCKMMSYTSEKCRAAELKKRRRIRKKAANRPRRLNPNTSPDHSIGRSDGRCVQRAGT